MRRPNVRHTENLSTENTNPLWKSFVILFIGLVITFTAAKYVNQEEENESEKEFILTCNEIKTNIFLRINLHVQFLINASSFFEASELVTRKEWEQFNKFSIKDENFKGVQGFGYAEIIKKEQLLKHIQKIKKEGFPQYTVYPKGSRDTYTSIIYIEPLNEKNRRALGFDMFSEPVRRKAMQQARDYHIPVLSGKVSLRQETNQDIQAGTILYVPVYKNVPLNTIAERRAAILGWVYSPFRMDDFMKSILSQWKLDDTTIQLKIYDDIISPKSLLFDSHKNIINNKIRTRILPVSFNGKKWNLVYSQPLRSPFFFSPTTLLIAIGGIIISLLLFALTYSLLITNHQAKIIAGRLSLDLSLKNQEYERINNSLKKNYKKLISSREKLKEANLKLRKAIIKAEESDRLKSAFLANMSHEIRTPMNGIMGFAELLKGADLSGEEQKSYIEIIEKSGIRLLNIINDIVDISKIEAGQMNTSFSTTNIDEQLQYIHSFFKLETEEKGLQLLLKKSSNDNGTTILTDREKLYAILINLVKNAIKFTNQGTIEFGYEKKENHVEFFVKDTGIGIAKDRQNAIFERFIQADYNNKMARQGAGLGLSIAKAYVELLGGKIWLKSESEKGSIFYFTIPCGNKLEENNANKIYIQDNQDNYPIKKLKVLIAEDDKISKTLITKILDSFSKEILTAKTGLEAVKICKKNPDIDLLLIDMQMPKMNGYEATMEIRKFNKEIVILAQTAFSLEGDKEKTIEAGCNGYISKPIKKQELSKLLHYYFGKQQQPT